MTTDIRAALENSIRLHEKATKWIFCKSTDRESVKIGQLASHLKITKDEAIDIVKQMCDNVAEKETLAQRMYIFVENNQFPKWLRPFVTPTMIHRSLRLADHTHYPTMEYNHQMRQMLFKADPNMANKLKDRLGSHEYITKQAMINSRVLTTPLASINYDKLDRLVCSGHFGLGGQSSLETTFESGIKLSVSYARYTYAYLDKLFADGKMDEPVFSAAKGSNPDSEEYQTRVKSVRVFIEEMNCHGYKLSDVHQMHGGDWSPRTILAFAYKDEYASQVRVTFPWAGFVVNIK